MPTLAVIIALLASVRALSWVDLNVTFVQQPQPGADGLFAPVLKVESATPADLVGASVRLQVSADSPPAAGLDGPARLPIDARGYANYSASWRRLITSCSMLRITRRQLCLEPSRR